MKNESRQDKVQRLGKGISALVGELRGGFLPPPPTLAATAAASQSPTKRDTGQGIPPIYQRWTVDDFPIAVPFCQPFLDGANLSLYLWSATAGSRKTSLACALLREWRRTRSLDSYFVPAYQYADTVRAQPDARYWPQSDWISCDLLVLDDVGAARNTPHMVESLTLLISRRYDHQRPTIITANMDLDALAAVLDSRVSSRLREPGGIVIDMGKTDWRAKG